MTTRGQKRTIDATENGAVANMLIGSTESLADDKDTPLNLANNSKEAVNNEEVGQLDSSVTAKDSSDKGRGPANAKDNTNIEEGEKEENLTPFKDPNYIQTLGSNIPNSTIMTIEDEKPFIENGGTFMPGNSAITTGHVPSSTTLLLTPYFDKNIKGFKGPIPLTIFDLEWQALADIKTDNMKHNNYTGYPYPDDLTLDYRTWCINYRNFLRTFANPYGWHSNSYVGRGGYGGRNVDRGGRPAYRGPPEKFDPNFAEKKAPALAAAKVKIPTV
ncbi:hypothetical protein DFH28DRAFT_1083632 [Melampsora americana]|nr:hypothetical protein DFH28DRAFT_1083632 [Melampsora americana]